MCVAFRRERAGRQGRMQDVLQFDARPACGGVGKARRRCTRSRAGAVGWNAGCDFYVIPRPALEHCSSWSPVAPLTPTAPVTLPSTMIGTPPGEANTPGRVAVAGPPLLIASMKTRVVRR